MSPDPVSLQTKHSLKFLTGIDLTNTSRHSVVTAIANALYSYLQSPEIPFALLTGPEHNPGIDYQTLGRAIRDMAYDDYNCASEQFRSRNLELPFDDEKVSATISDPLLKSLFGAYMAFSRDVFARRDTAVSYTAMCELLQPPEWDRRTFRNRSHMHSVYQRSLETAIEQDICRLRAEMETDVHMLLKHPKTAQITRPQEYIEAEAKEKQSLLADFANLDNTIIDLLSYRSTGMTKDWQRRGWARLKRDTTKLSQKVGVCRRNGTGIWDMNRVKASESSWTFSCPKKDCDWEVTVTREAKNNVMTEMRVETPRRDMEIYMGMSADNDANRIHDQGSPMEVD